MPFEDADLEVVYEDFVKPILEQECNLICERGDDVFGSNAIIEDIVGSIQKADVVLADLTRKKRQRVLRSGNMSCDRKEGFAPCSVDRRYPI